jgi:hypothetical protein
LFLLERLDYPLIIISLKTKKKKKKEVTPQSPRGFPPLLQQQDQQ